MRAYVFSTCVCITFLSCRKEPTYDYLAPDLRQAFATLKKGSYWIYEDSASGRTDSFAVYADAGTYFQGDGSGYNEERGGFGMTEYGYTSAGWDTVNWVVLLYGHNAHVNITCEKPGKAQAGFSYVYQPPGTTVPEDIQASRLPSLRIYGNTFYDVIFSTASAQTTPKSYACVNLDPGILALRQTHPYFNRTLKLIRWRLIR